MSEPSRRLSLMFGLFRVALVVLLFLGCTQGPLLLMRRAGPWAGIGSALAAVLAWAVLGPRPMPGLLQGTSAMIVFGENVVVIIWCVTTLLRAAL